MRFEKGFVRSKVARRILIGFISCAIVPVSALALISFGQVEKQLREQAQRELRLTSKAVGLAIVERLSFLEAEMEIWAEKIRHGPLELEASAPDSLQRKHDRFRELCLVRGTGVVRQLVGDRGEEPPPLTAAQKEHLASGKATVKTRVTAGEPSRLFMYRAVEAGKPERGFLAGEIDPLYLWGEEYSASFHAAAGLCVHDSLRNVVFCSLGLDESSEELVEDEAFSSVHGEFDLTLEGRDYLATYWSIPLQYDLLVPEWKVILFKSRDQVFTPMASFKSTLVLFFVLTVMVVLLLSSVQIRKNLVPLVRLKEGTVRVAAREFQSKIDVRSGDEFEDLADSFNAMAGQLSKQFDMLTTMSDIDRKILSVLDAEEIIQSVITRLPRVIACEAVSMTLFGGQQTDSVETYVEDGDGRVLRLETARPPDEELEKFSERPEYVTISEGEPAPSWLHHLTERGCKSFLLFPVLLKGEMTGIIALGHSRTADYSREDLTQARRVVTQVAIALSNANLVAKLETANQVKNSFLANMSHELRTPLNAILGYAELLKMRWTEDSSALEDLQIIERNGRHLLELINDVLDISKIEALQLETECIAVPPLGILKEVLAVMDVWAREKGIAVGYRCDTPIPEQIYSDPTRIHQVLNNLIGNAIKFTEKGSVAVLMRVREGEGDESWLEFRVRDTGIGIPEDKLDALFEPFTQVDPSFTRKYGGTGLGLSISYRLSRLLGGSLEVETELGRGSTFTFSLPCKTPEGVQMVRDSSGLEDIEDDAARATARELRLNGRVLVVEDTLESRQLVRKFLEESGCRVEAVANGADAIRLCSEEDFDVLLMDIHMPEKDGFQTLAALRENGVQTPAVALTAHAMKGDRERCLEAGFAGYLSKPVRSKLLLQTLASYIGEDAGEKDACSQTSDVA